MDDWYWLRDRDNPEVLRYLEEENRWAEVTMTSTATLRDALFEEIRSRIQETDVGPPVGHGPWWYYTRTSEGLQYAIHCRRTRQAPDQPAAAALADGAEETVVLDENALAAGHDYFRLGALDLSPDHTIAAYSTDFDGDEVFTMRFRDVAAGADLEDAIPGTYYGTAWSADGTRLFYTTVDPAMRPWRVHRHRVGTPATADVLVYQEDDEHFHVGLGTTRSRAWVVIGSGSMVTSEVSVVPAAEPDAGPRVVVPRRHGVEYDVDHQGDRFLLVTNDEAENFRLVEAPVDDPRRENWRELVPHRPDVRLLGVDAFARHLVLHER
ncbi:MAG TPA: oligopeptidase B, partial [Acidimicrobiia bacterium]|nr:oligopeptidase B [Acidimicrobiia bacterium]